MKHTIFQDSIFVDNFEDEQFHELSKKILSDEKEKGIGVHKSNEHGYQTPNITNKYLENKLLQWSATVFSNDFFYKRGFEINFLNMWINDNNQYSYNREHNHSNSHFSGVYYVECPPDTGHIYFKRPDYSSTMSGLWEYFDDMNEFSCMYPLKNYKNQFLLFPSYMVHGVTHNPLDKTRITVAFNIKLKFKDN